MEIKIGDRFLRVSHKLYYENIYAGDICRVTKADTELSQVFLVCERNEQRIYAHTTDFLNPFIWKRVVEFNAVITATPSASIDVRVSNKLNTTPLIPTPMCSLCATIGTFPVRWLRSRKRSICDSCYLAQEPTGNPPPKAAPAKRPLCSSQPDQSFFGRANVLSPGWNKRG